MTKKNDKKYKADLSDYDHRSDKNKRRNKNSSRAVYTEVPDAYASSLPFDTGNDDNDVND